MKLVTVLAAMIFALYAQSVSLDAQGRGKAQVKKTSTSVKTPKAKSSTQTPKNTAKKTAKVDARAGKAETRAAKTVAKADTRAAKTTAKAEKRAIKAEAKTARTETATAPAPAPVLTTTIISPETPTTHSVKNPKLEARLLTLLPAGITVQDASQGFKNWGQFVAAVHVSNNLNIPFADLKARMTGITPGTIPGSTVQTAPMSLGQAIQSYKGTSETGVLSPTRINNEVKKAEDAANTDLRRTRETS